jgi:hypothetical protein
MNAVRRLFSPWKVLLAAFAICATAAPARADLYLKITDTSDPSNTPTTYHITGTGTTTNTDFDGFTIKYSAATTQSAGHATLSLTASVINTGGSIGSFRFELLTSSSTGSTPASNPTSGYFSGSVVGDGEHIKLFSTLSTTDFVSGSKVTANSSYTGYDGSTAGGIQTVTPGSSDKVSVTSGNSSATGGVTSFTQANGTTSFDLSSISTDVQSSGKGTVSFVATTVAMPEPSGTVAALAGLPCLGLLVGFARRRAQLRAAQVI